MTASACALASALRAAAATSAAAATVVAPGGSFNGEGLGGGGCSFLDSIVTENVSLASENINNGFVTISRVPEPSTWVMMLLGLACLGFAGYRRAKRGSAAFAD
jgi:hypothetical protein